MKYSLVLSIASLFLSNLVYAQKSSNFRNTYVPQYVPLPLETFQESNRIKQAEYDQRIANCQEELAKLYKEATTYPQIQDGRHLANIVGPGACYERYVIVQQGKVSSIIKNDGSYITEFTISTPVKSCISKVWISDSETGVSDYYNIVFLKDIYGN